MPGVNAEHIAAQAAGFEPQRQSNWEFEVELGSGDDKEIIRLSAISFALPNENNDPLELPYGNEKVYAAGKANFDASALVLRDYVDQETRNAILRWRRLVYDPETGAVGLARDYKKRASIVLKGPDGSTVYDREVELIGCWPQAVTAGTLDYSAGDPVQIEVTIQYDKAIWNTGA